MNYKTSNKQGYVSANQKSTLEERTMTVDAKK
jgi:hypothetical protein